MAAPYRYIAKQIKDTYDLYQNLVMHGKKLEEYEKKQKEMVERLYKVVIELERENNLSIK